MTWVKIDDGAPEHPKLVDLSDAGLALWLRALCYCARRRTDGLVPTGALRILSRAKAPVKLATELVTAKLWDVCEDGYRVHDYHHYQPSKAQAEAAADAASEAKRAAGKLGGKKSAEVRWGASARAADGKQTVSRPPANPQHNVTPDPDPDPGDPETHTPRAGEAEPYPEPEPTVAQPSAPARPVVVVAEPLGGVESPEPPGKLSTLVGELAAEGSDFGKACKARLDAMERLTPKMQLRLREIAGQRDELAKLPAAARKAGTTGHGRPLPTSYQLPALKHRGLCAGLRLDQMSPEERAIFDAQTPEYRAEYLSDSVEPEPEPGAKHA